MVKNLTELGEKTLFFSQAPEIPNPCFKNFIEFPGFPLEEITIFNILLFNFNFN